MDYITPKDVYIRGAWFAICISGIVFVEPAPYDVAIMILLFIGLLTKKLEYPRQITLPLVLIWIFYIGNLISLFSCNNDTSALKFLFITIYLSVSWLFIVGFLFRYGDLGLKVLVSSYIFAAVISIGIGFYGYFILNQFEGTIVKFGRISSTFKDPNVFGPFLIFPALMSIAYIELKSRRIRILWVMIFLLATAGILLSFSRAAWLGYIVSLVCYVLCRTINEAPISKKIRVTLAFIIIVVIAFSVVAYLSNVPIVKHVLPTRLGLQVYDIQRFSVQNAALRDIVDMPLGIGPGQSAYIYGIGTHNLYLRVWAENGFIGFIGLALFILLTLFYAFRLALKKSNPNKAVFSAVAGALAGLFITSFFIDSIHWRHLWLLMAIPWAFRHEKSHSLSYD